MLNKKIIFTRTHEDVNFEGKYQSNFATISRPGKSIVEMELIPDLQCIRVFNDNDEVIIPLVNIAFLKLESKLSIEREEAAKKEAAKPKSNPKLNTVKRPR